MKQRKHIFAFALLGLALQCHGADQQAKLKSYDHFKVVKIQTSSEDVLHELEAFDGLDLVKVSLMKGNIDVMVPPSMYPTLTSFLVQSNLTFSTMIEDVGKLINPKQVCTFYLVFTVIFSFNFRTASQNLEAKKKKTMIPTTRLMKSTIILRCLRRDMPLYPLMKLV